MNTPPSIAKVQTTTDFRISKFPTIPGLPGIDNANHLLANQKITLPPEVVNGMLHQGTKAVLASSSKVGKTWILLDLALSVATGSCFLGRQTQSGKVLFLNFELPRAFIKSRLEVIMDHRQITQADNCNFWNLRGKTADFEALIANIIKSTQDMRYSLIILDPIYKAMNGKSENSAAGVGALCNQLERLAEKTGACILFSHHFPKGNPKKKAALDRLSGSGVYTRDADSVILLTEHAEPHCYTVEMVLRNFPQQSSFVVQWDYPVMVQREDLDPEDVVIEEMEDEDDHGLLNILEFLPHTTSEWEIKALALGLSRSTFFRVKRKLLDNGYVTFDFKTKLWSNLKVTGGEAGATGDTTDTAETGETGETAEG